MSLMVTSELSVLAPNQWQGSIPTGRMMSSCHLGKASEGAETLNRREGIALVAGTGLGTSMGWFLTSTSGHILASVVGHANGAGSQGRLPHGGGMLEIEEGARTMTVRLTSGGARFGWHVTL